MENVNISWKSGIKKLIAIMLIMVMLPIIPIQSASAESLSISIGSAIEGQKISFSWNSITNSVRYEYSVRDLTTDEVIIFHEETTKTSGSIPASYVIKDHQYKVWVGAFYEVTEDNMPEATANSYITECAKKEKSTLYGTTYELYNDTYHKRYDVYDITCKVCGDHIEYRNETTKEKHTMKNGKCTVCGYEEEPDPLDVVVSRNQANAQVGDSIGATAEITGGSGSYLRDWTVTCDDETITTSSNNESEFNWKATKAGSWKFKITVLDNNTGEKVSDTSSAITVSEAECTHENTTETLIDTEYIQKNENHHTVRNYYRITCSNPSCGVILNPSYYKDTDEEHTFGADGKCKNCGYVPPTDECDHENITPELLRTELRQCDSDNNHYSVAIYKDVCADCGVTVKEEREVITLAPHEFVNGVCACGFAEPTPECDHATTRDKVSTVLEQYSDTAHRMVITYHVYCECGQVDYEEEIESFPEHQFDSNGLCECGYQKVEETSVSFTVDKTTVTIGENVTFTITTNAASVDFVADGTAYNTVEVTGGSATYVRAFTEQGDRQIKFVAPDGTSSDTKTIHVTAKGQLAQTTISVPSSVEEGNSVTASWTAVDHADNYVVRLYDDAPTELWKQETAGTSITIPASLLEADKHYTVSVIATGTDYTQSESSAGFIVTAQATTVSFTVDKTEVTVGENVTFTITTNATSVDFVADGTAYNTVEVTGGSATYVRAFTEQGDRQIQFVAPDGTSSDTKTIRVTAKGQLDQTTISVPSSVEEGNSVTASWTAVDHAENYVARLYDDVPTELWKQETPGTSVTIPANLLEADKHYTVSVIATGTDYTQSESSAGFVVNAKQEEIVINGAFGQDSYTITAGETLDVAVSASVQNANLTRVTINVDGSDNNRLSSKEISGTSWNGALTLDGTAAPLNVPGTYTIKLFVGVDAGDPNWAEVDQATLTVTAPEEDNPKLPDPVIISPTAGDVLENTTFTLSWNAVNGADHYVYTASDLSQDAVKVIPVTATNGLSVELTLPEKGHNYRAAVGAVPAGVNDNESDKISWSTVEFSVQAEPKQLADPTITYPSNGAVLDSTSVTVSWNDVDGAVDFAISVYDITSDKYIADRELTDYAFNAVINDLEWFHQYRVAVGAVPRKANGDSTKYSWSTVEFSVARAFIGTPTLEATGYYSVNGDPTYRVTAITDGHITRLSGVNDTGTPLNETWDKTTNADGTITWVRVYTPGMSANNRTWTLTAWVGDQQIEQATTNAASMHVHTYGNKQWRGHPHQYYQVCTVCNHELLLANQYYTANGTVQDPAVCCVCHGHQYGDAYEENGAWYQKCINCGKTVGAVEPEESYGSDEVKEDLKQSIFDDTRLINDLCDVVSGEPVQFDNGLEVDLDSITDITDTVASKAYFNATGDILTTNGLDETRAFYLADKIARDYCISGYENASKQRVNFRTFKTILKYVGFGDEVVDDIVENYLLSLADSFGTMKDVIVSKNGSPVNFIYSEPDAFDLLLSTNEDAIEMYYDPDTFTKLLEQGYKSDNPWYSDVSETVDNLKAIGKGIKIGTYLGNILDDCFAYSSADKEAISDLADALRFSKDSVCRSTAEMLDLMETDGGCIYLSLISNGIEIAEKEIYGAVSKGGMALLKSVRPEFYYAIKGSLLFNETILGINSTYAAAYETQWAIEATNAYREAFEEQLVKFDNNSDEEFYDTCLASAVYIELLALSYDSYGNFAKKQDSAWASKQINWIKGKDNSDAIKEFSNIATLVRDMGMKFSLQGYYEERSNYGAEAPSWYFK